MYPISSLDFKTIINWTKNELSLIFLGILMISFLISSFFAESTSSDVEQNIIKTNVIGVYVENANNLKLDEEISFSHPSTIKINIEKLPNSDFNIIKIRK